jgi:N-methylhydantoinase A
VQGVGYAVVDRGALGDDARLTGPAIVEQEDSTVVVPPGWALRAASAGTLLLERT